MPVKARSSSRVSSYSPNAIGGFDEHVFRKEKPKYGHMKTLWCQETRVRIFGGLLTVLAVLFLKSALSRQNDGPPRDLVVVGKRTFYQHVPTNFKRRFYVDDDNKFRRTVIRAFRNRGWRKANKPEEAQFIWDKYAEEDRFSELLPWQRYSHYPGA